MESIWKSCIRLRHVVLQAGNPMRQASLFNSQWLQGTCLKVLSSSPTVRATNTRVFAHVVLIPKLLAFSLATELLGKHYKTGFWQNKQGK